MKRATPYELLKMLKDQEICIEVDGRMYRLGEIKA
jgi:hypothetical protein